MNAYQQGFIAVIKLAGLKVAGGGADAKYEAALAKSKGAPLAGLRPGKGSPGAQPKPDHVGKAVNKMNTKGPGGTTVTKWRSGAGPGGPTR